MVLTRAKETLLDQAATMSNLPRASPAAAIHSAATTLPRDTSPTPTPASKHLSRAPTASFTCGAMASRSTTGPSSATTTLRIRARWR
jgi:hypothetical protein